MILFHTTNFVHGLKMRYTSENGNEWDTKGVQYLYIKSINKRRVAMAYTVTTNVLNATDIPITSYKANLIIQISHTECAILSSNHVQMNPLTLTHPH